MCFRIELIRTYECYCDFDVWFKNVFAKLIFLKLHIFFINNVIEIELLFHFHDIFVINPINWIIFVILKRLVYDFNNRLFFENCKNENKRLICSRNNDFNDYIAFDLNQNTLFILSCNINFQTNKILKFKICWNVIVKICKFVDCKIINEFNEFWKFDTW